MKDPCIEVQKEYVNQLDGNITADGYTFPAYDSPPADLSDDYIYLVDFSNQEQHKDKDTFDHNVTATVEVITHHTEDNRSKKRGALATEEILKKLIPKADSLLDFGSDFKHITTTLEQRRVLSEQTEAVFVYRHLLIVNHLISSK